MISVTSIEEIVKYQQELLNHQRNQKHIQHETIKLLNALNKNISFMSDRLDEFANKTNIKLETNSAEPFLSLTSTSLTNAAVDSFFNSCFESHNNLNANDIDLKDYLSSNELDQQNSSQTVAVPVSQQLVLIPHDSLISCNNNNNNTLISNANSQVKTATKRNKKNNNSSNTNQHRATSISALLDTSNITSQSKTATSDESIDEDLSYDDTTDEEEKETIQVKKKPKNTILELTTNNCNNVNTTAKTNTKELEECNNQQRFFNKYVRESVEKKLGKDFLLMHEIQEINSEVMEEIKREALQAYPPVNIRPRRAWHLAKASLRCRRRSLRRQKEKQILSSSSDNILNETSHNMNEEPIKSSVQLQDTPKTIIKMSSI